MRNTHSLHNPTRRRRCLALLACLVLVALCIPRAAFGKERELGEAVAIKLVSIAGNIGGISEEDGPDKPLHLGVIADRDFVNSVSRALGSLRATNGQPLHLISGNNPADLDSCRIILIQDPFRAPDITRAFEGKPVLVATLVDKSRRSDDTQCGVVFVIEGNKLNFRIHSKVLQRSGLTLSTSLQALENRKAEADERSRK